MRMEFKDKVARQNCAVVLVDLQNDFCDQKGAWGKIVADPDLSKRIEAIQSFLPEARSTKVPVLFLRTANSDLGGRFLACAVSQRFRNIFGGSLQIRQESH
jgi:nicotinamidase-related amidase